MRFNKGRSRDPASCVSSTRIVCSPAPDEMSHTPHTPGLMGLPVLSHLHLHRFHWRACDDHGVVLNVNGQQMPPEGVER